MIRLAQIACVSIVCGCGNVASGPVERLVAASARTGAAGELGPLRVLHSEWQAQARVSEAITVEATYPESGRGPVVLWVSGGLVPTARYQWLADHLASRGYTVIVPRYLWTLAFFENDNARLALTSAERRGLVGSDAKVAVGGHSLGGVVAAWNFGADDRFDALFLLASYPADGDTRQRGRPVLSIAGANDEKSKVEQVRDGLRRYASPRSFFVAPGMNHYAWTDDASAGELKTDGALDGDLQVVRKSALVVLDSWLDATLLDDPVAQALLGTLIDPEESAR